MFTKAITPRGGVALALSLAAAGLALTVGPAQAQPYASVSGVTVQAPPRFVRQPATGARVRLDQVSYVVSLSDLDLSSRRGALLAKARIQRAARDVCDEVQARYRGDEDIDGGCYSTALRNALIQTERIAGYPIVAWGYR